MAAKLKIRGKISIALLSCFFLIISAVTAQAQTVSGVVHSESDSQPIQGVTVNVKGTSQSTVTDAKGHYELRNVGQSASINFSYVGFRNETIPVAGRTQVDISLKAEASSLDQIVVVGYGTQKKTSVTASISKVQNDMLDQVPSGRIETALIGRMAGVNISTDRSIPGAAPTISIRGMGSISAGNTPLIVIDGFPGGDLGQLDMNDVESFEVLKDASSASIYGSRGAGGVILVTTKKGKSGAPKLSLNAYFGISKAIMPQDWLTGTEWYDYLVKYQNREFAWVGGDVSLPMFNDPRRPTVYQVNPLTYTLPQTVWQNEVSQTAPIQSYNLSVRGGSDNVKYFVSGTYRNEQGAIKTAGYQQYSFRANVDVKVNKVIDFGVELNPSYSKQRVAGSNMVSLAKYPPFVSPNMLNGRYPRTFDYIPFGHSGQASPYTFLYGTQNYNNSFTNMGQAFVNFKLLDGLTLRSSVGANVGFLTNNFYSSGAGDPQVATNGYVSKTQNINLINENVLSYTKTLNKVHDIGGILGASYQKNNSENLLMTATPSSFNNDRITTLNNAIINPSKSTQLKSEWGLISYFSRVNYAYKSKYLFSASIRADGSSRFGPDNKWGYFPSASAAWRVSQEKFMQSISAISELKLKASYGVTGNFNIGDFQYLGTIGGVVYSPNNTTVNGIAQTAIENSQLSWEKVKGIDLGIELGLFNNRVNINFDYYDKTTDGMLYAVNIPAVTGFTSAIQNAGSIKNRGIDVEINTRNLVGAFKWSTSFNVSHNKNEVLDLGGVDERINTNVSMDWLLRKGVPMFSYYGYKMIGVFKNADEITKAAHLVGTLPGDPKVQDVNGDGKIDDKDRVVLGNFQPKALLAMTNNFSYKRFDLSITLQASLGAKIFNEENVFYEGATMGAMRRSLVQNQWYSETDPGDGKTPAASLSRLYGYITNTDFYIENGSFLNFRNLNFGYNLSSAALSKAIKSLRVYTSVSNLLIIKDKNNHAYNPEGTTMGGISGINSTPGFNQGSEPLNRTIVVGINVGF